MSSPENEDRPRLAGEIRVALGAKKLFKVAEAMQTINGLQWQELNPAAPRTIGLAQAAQLCQELVQEQGMRSGLRMSTMNNWAAKLADKVLQDGRFSPEGAASYAAKLSKFIGDMPPKKGFELAQKLGIEPEIPYAEEIERLAAIAESKGMGYPLRVLERLKTDLTQGAEVRADEILDTLKHEIPDLQEKTGYVVRFFEPGVPVPREEVFGRFEDAAMAFKNLEANSRASIVFDEIDLISHKLDGSGLSFLNPAVKDRYLDAMLEGVGQDFQILANINGHAASFSLSGIADDFHRFTQNILNSAVTAEDFNHDQHQHEEPQQKRSSGPRMR